MRDMAEELLKLYAQRKLAQGFAFSADSNWQREFEDAFEFTETRDQKTAIADIKRDMESPQPMDRLLCGDVGYGKTEVVMRAAFKALGDGKQVAVLAPTTVLCFQHFETFKKRFQPFPVRIEMFSRFRSAKEIKAVLDDLAEGKVDLVVGTHRLFSKDVVWKDLGLVIIDEEQRFGVKHKERLKEICKGVDVVAMSATPIPRTLHMSLLGLRDHVGDRDAAQGSPGDPDRGRAVCAGPDQVRDRAGTGARRPGLLRAQPHRFHLAARGDGSGDVSRSAHRRGPRPDGGSGAREGDAAVHAPRVRCVCLHHHRGERPRYSARQHDDHRERRALRACRSCISCAAAWAGRTGARIAICWSSRIRSSPKSRASGWPR